MSLKQLDKTCPKCDTGKLVEQVTVRNVVIRKCGSLDGEGKFVKGCGYFGQYGHIKKTAAVPAAPAVTNEESNEGLTPIEEATHRGARTKPATRGVKRTPAKKAAVSRERIRSVRDPEPEAKRGGFLSRLLNTRIG